MKYLQPIAKAMELRIEKASSDGYSGYRVLNKHEMSVGQFFDSLDSVAEYLSGIISKQEREMTFEEFYKECDKIVVNILGLGIDDQCRS